MEQGHPPQQVSVPETIAAVESRGFVIVRVVTDDYSENASMFRRMGNGCLSTALAHSHDPNGAMFLSFVACQERTQECTCS